MTKSMADLAGPENKEKKELKTQKSVQLRTVRAAIARCGGSVEPSHKFGNSSSMPARPCALLPAAR